MYYALIDERGPCDAQTILAWGSLKQIADTLVEECRMLMENTDSMSMEELEEEYYCEFDDYKKLVTCKNPTFEMLYRFSFTLSDCTTDVACLVEGYPALVEAFAEYAEDKTTLDPWRLVPTIEETQENLEKLDCEIRSLNDSCRDHYEFLIEAEYDDADTCDDDEDEDIEWEHYFGFPFAMEVVNGEILSLTAEFQAKILQRILSRADASREDLIAYLADGAESDEFEDLAEFDYEFLVEFLGFDPDEESFELNGFDEFDCSYGWEAKELLEQLEFPLVERINEMPHGHGTNGVVYYKSS